MKKDDIVNQFEDQIKDIADQDKVRNGLVGKELEDGTLDETLQHLAVTGWLMYSYALQAGFTDDQAFELASKQMFGGSNND